jgi:2',3'-cyclic-nucleotide 2'-phosphodiesterase (5'-nucleotidase family)
MRAERAARPFTEAGERAAVDRTRTRFALLTAGGGMIAGLAALVVRAAVPAGALSFGALAALLLLSVTLTALAMRREIVQRNTDED